MKKIILDLLEKRKIYKETLKSRKDKFKFMLPNILCYIRLLTPALVLPIALTGNFDLALGIGIAGAVTDMFDGYFARKYDAVSEYGKTLDVITDKSYAVMMSLPLFFHPQYIASIVLGELAIGIINYKSSLKGNEPESSILGKIKSAAVFSYICLAYLAYGGNIPLETLQVPLICANTLQTASAIQYKNSDRKKEIEKEKRELEALKKSLVSEDKEIAKQKSLK